MNSMTYDEYSEQVKKLTSHNFDNDYVYKNFYPFKKFDSLYECVISENCIEELRKFNTYLWVMREYHELWDL